MAALPLLAHAAPVTLIQAGHVLDKPGQAPRAATTLVVEGGKISAVLDGFVGAEKYPEARIIDLRTRYVLPGLIDSHVHLTSDRAGNDGALALVTTSQAASAMPTGCRNTLPTTTCATAWKAAAAPCASRSAAAWTSSR